MNKHACVFVILEGSSLYRYACVCCLLSACVVAFVSVQELLLSTCTHARVSASWPLRHCQDSFFLFRSCMHSCLVHVHMHMCGGFFGPSRQEKPYL